MNLKDIPILGALAGDGVKTSEGVGLAGLFAWAITGPMDLAKAIAVAGLALGLGLYANARSHAKDAAKVVAVLLCALAFTGCATGQADSGASNPVHGNSGGFLGAETFDADTFTVNVYLHPAGMEQWSPEQIAAYASTNRSFGDLFYSRQDITPSSERGSGDTAASPTNSVPVSVDPKAAADALKGITVPVPIPGQ